MRSIDIHYPGDKTVTVGPVARAGLEELERLLVELQSYWIEEEFSLGDVMARDDCWDLMVRISGLLPRLDAPGKTGFDLEPLETDYDQLENLFFAQSTAIEQSTFDLDSFTPCLIFALHKYNPKKKLLAANELMLSRLEKSRPDPLPPLTSLLSQVA